MELTYNQAVFLDSVQRAGFNVGEWFRPMDIGGRNGSGHSSLLAQLERKGLVESRQRSGGVRGSKLYRLTDAGRAFKPDYEDPRCGMWTETGT